MSFVNRAKEVLKPGAPGDTTSSLLDDAAYDAEEAQFLEKLNFRRDQARLVADFERRRSKMTFKEQIIDQSRRELLLLKTEWAILLFAFFWVYIHSVATNWVYYEYHRDGLGELPPLPDALFLAFGKLPDGLTNIGDWLFYVMMVCIVAFVASGFFKVQKGLPLFTVNVVSRVFVLVTIAETLRMISFLTTRLPGPSDHCRASSPDYNPPLTVGEIWSRLDAFEGCGDLIFSSHTLIVLTCSLTFHYYCKNKYIKIAMWLLVALLSILVIVAHRHYTVDVVVGWWTVPLVWWWYWGWRPDPPFPVLATDPALADSKSARLRGGSSLDSLGDVGDGELEAQLEAHTRSPKVIDQRAGSITRSIDEGDHSVMRSTDADKSRVERSENSISASAASERKETDPVSASQGKTVVLVDEKGTVNHDSGAGDIIGESPVEDGDAQSGTGDSDSSQ